jgi:transposase, IS5 family
MLRIRSEIVDATIVAAPKQRNTKAQKQAIKEGRIPEDWRNKPAKLAQKSLPSGLTRGTATPAGVVAP